MDKKELWPALKKFEGILKDKFRDNKEKIINEVGISSGSYPEGYFVKNYLAKYLFDFFETYVHIEGINSEGLTQYKNDFFCSKPAPDFIVKEPYNLVGEVKYCNLSTRELATAIGQAIMYLHSSRSEEFVYEFGLIICFDKSMKHTSLDSSEEILIKELWDKENIFIVIV